MWCFFVGKSGGHDGEVGLVEEAWGWGLGVDEEMDGAVGERKGVVEDAEVGFVWTLEWVLDVAGRMGDSVVKRVLVGEDGGDGYVGETSGLEV